jgi:signal recognition particle GTPase
LGGIVESRVMFDSLADKLQGTLHGVRQRGALTEEDISKAMREIRLAPARGRTSTSRWSRQFTKPVKERAPASRSPSSSTRASRSSRSSTRS